MAARVIAQLIIQGVTIFSKAFVTAYQQALRNAKAGGASVPNAAAKTMKYKIHPDEACKILHIEKSVLNKNIIEERYKVLLAANDPKKGGSFYLQSKVFRAKEVLDKVLNEPKEGEGPADGSAAGSSSEASAAESTSTNDKK